MAGVFPRRAVAGLSRCLLGNSLALVVPLWQLLSGGSLPLVVPLRQIPFCGVLALAVPPSWLVGGGSFFLAVFPPRLGLCSAPLVCAGLSRCLLGDSWA